MSRKKQSGVRKVKGFRELAKLSVFSVADVESLTENVHTARSMLARLMDKGYVRKIRNNMYSAVNPSTDSVVASKYQIACAINDSAYLTQLSSTDSPTRSIMRCMWHLNPDLKTLTSRISPTGGWPQGSTEGLSNLDIRRESG